MSHILIFDNSLNRKNPETPSKHITHDLNFKTFAESLEEKSINCHRISVLIGSFLLIGFDNIRVPPSSTSFKNLSEHRFELEDNS